MTRGVKTKLTPAQWKKMGEMAKDGCQNGTIARLMDLAEQTITDNKQIRDFLHKKRCEGKRELRKAQRETAIDAKNPTMQIFLGKNILDQADKREARVSGEIHVHIRD